MASSSTIKTTSVDLGAKKFLKQVSAIRGQSVKVGIQSDSSSHKDKETGKTSKMVIIAATHEFGTKKAGRNKNITVPKRSYIRSTVDEKTQTWWNKSADLINEIIMGNLTAKRLLVLMGLIMQTDIQLKIKSNIAPKLTSRTGTALWDSGQLINMIRYITSLGDVQPKGKK